MTQASSPDSIFSLSGLFVRGKYDDYGGIEQIDDTHASRTLYDELVKRRETLFVDETDSHVDWKTLASIISRGIQCGTVYVKNDKEFSTSYIMMHEPIFDGLVKTEGRTPLDFVWE